MLAKSQRSANVLLSFMSRGVLIRGVIKECPTPDIKIRVEVSLYVWCTYQDTDLNSFYPGTHYVSRVQDNVIQNDTGLSKIYLPQRSTGLNKKLMELIRSWQIEHPSWCQEKPVIITYQAMDGTETVVDLNDPRVRDHLNRLHQRLAYEADLGDEKLERLNWKRRMHKGNIPELGGHGSSYIQVLAWRMGHILAEIYQ